VEIIHFLDDIGQPYSCTQWGNAGSSGIPPIVDDGTINTFNWFNNPGGEYPLIIFLDHTMEIVNIMGSSPSLTMSNIIIDVMLDAIPVDVEGCIDESACNYNSAATMDDGSCLENDCAVVCGGSAVEDVCGTCNGSVTDATQCACPGGQAKDCAGVCGGTAVDDECGICGGTGPADNYDCAGNCTNLDCAGFCGGSAAEDACGICDGTIIEVSDCGVDCNATGENLNQYGLDCNGACSGTAVEDECGVCAGSGSPTNYNCAGECMPGVDCNGQCGGALLGTGDGIGNDACGICGGSGPPENYNCALQCIAEVDICGVCNGNGCHNQDCTIYPQSYYDCNGNCDIEGDADAEGLCDGQLAIDNNFYHKEFHIHKIYPNPFNPVLHINFNVAWSGVIQVDILNITGSHIKTLYCGYLQSGSHELSWNAESIPSGMYLVSLKSGDESLIEKVVLLK